MMPEVMGSSPGWCLFLLKCVKNTKIENCPQLTSERVLKYQNFPQLAPEGMPKYQDYPQLKPERVPKYQNCPQLTPESVLQITYTSKVNHKKKWQKCQRSTQALTTENVRLCVT